MPRLVVHVEQHGALVGFLMEAFELRVRKLALLEKIVQLFAFFLENYLEQRFALRLRDHQRLKIQSKAIVSAICIPEPQHEGNVARRKQPGLFRGTGEIAPNLLFGRSSKEEDRRGLRDRELHSCRHQVSEDRGGTVLTRRQIVAEPEREMAADYPRPLRNALGQLPILMLLYQLHELFFIIPRVG